jgi:hypothetical protein
MQTHDGSTLLNMILVEENNTTTSSNYTSGFFRYVVNDIPVYATSIPDLTDAFWMENYFSPPTKMMAANCGPECGGDGGGGNTITTAGGNNPNTGCSLGATLSSGTLGSAISLDQCLTVYLVSYLKANAQTNPAYGVLVVVLSALVGFACGPICAVAVGLMLAFGWYVIQQIDVAGGNKGIYSASCSQGLLVFLTPFCSWYSLTSQWIAPNPVPSGF